MPKNTAPTTPRAPTPTVRPVARPARGAQPTAPASAPAAPAATEAPKRKRRSSSVVTGSATWAGPTSAREGRDLARTLGMVEQYVKRYMGKTSDRKMFTTMLTARVGPSSAGGSTRGAQGANAGS